MSNEVADPKTDHVSIRQALISVSNKNGLVELCQTLKEQRIKIFCTEGTAAFLTKSNIDATRIETVTEFPEMMDGRVKTLHPKIFGGILARRNKSEDTEAALRHAIPLFDLVVVNLYPFWDHLGKTPDAQSSFVDIGGPSLMRAAAKNFDAVTVLSDPEDYAGFVEELNQRHGTRREFRHRMAAKTFRRTSQYDQAIADEWNGRDEFPVQISFPVQRPLRYGENPHQKAVWAATHEPKWKVRQGKELSYNNLLDVEAAARVIAEFVLPAVCIVKHNNPCGVASFDQPLNQVFTRAFEADSKSAFGGIVACNRTVDAETANVMSPIFLEVVLAPAFSPAALEIFSNKKNLRLIEWEQFSFPAFEIRAAMDGYLLQSTDLPGRILNYRGVTKTPIDATAASDLEFAWKVCKHVRSNAIVIVKNGVTLGLGGGQTSRVDAVTIAIEKARQCHGAVLASDAFFPFRDNIDLLKTTGIKAVIQPGGSQRDSEVIEACNEHGIAMVFTGERHFRH
jgi:phosphoribosylaminoimidazolecarboxamide formyltransferase/IMP cyclohydrolase